MSTTPLIVIPTGMCVCSPFDSPQSRHICLINPSNKPILFNVKPRNDLPCSVAPSHGEVSPFDFIEVIITIQPVTVALPDLFFDIELAVEENDNFSWPENPEQVDTVQVKLLRDSTESDQKEDFLHLVRDTNNEMDAFICQLEKTYRPKYSKYKPRHKKIRALIAISLAMVLLGYMFKQPILDTIAPPPKKNWLFF